MEGTYFKDGTVRPFRPGGAVLAIGVGMKVVPVAIHSKANIEGLLIKGTWKNPLRVIIGEPFSVEGKTYDDRYDVARQTQNAVLDLLSSD